VGTASFGVTGEPQSLPCLLDRPGDQSDNCPTATSDKG
jgi:hypothetical protein